MLGGEIDAPILTGVSAAGKWKTEIRYFGSWIGLHEIHTGWFGFLSEGFKKGFLNFTNSMDCYFFSQLEIYIR